MIYLFIKNVFIVYFFSQVTNIGFFGETIYFRVILKKVVQSLNSTFHAM